MNCRSCQRAAFSSAFKRASVKHGVGRNLYRLLRQWLDYDAQKRQFVRMPTLPPDALPRARAARLLHARTPPAKTEKPLAAQADKQKQLALILDSDADSAPLSPPWTPTPS